MKEIGGYYLEEDNIKFIKERAKKRGDKFKIVNEDLTLLRQKHMNNEKLKVTIKI